MKKRNKAIELFFKINFFVCGAFGKPLLSVLSVMSAWMFFKSMWNWEDPDSHAGMYSLLYFSMMVWIYSAGVFYNPDDEKQ